MPKSPSQHKFFETAQNADLQGMPRAFKARNLIKSVFLCGALASSNACESKELEAFSDSLEDRMGQDTDMPTDYDARFEEKANTDVPSDTELEPNSPDTVEQLSPSDYVLIGDKVMRGVERSYDREPEYIGGRYQSSEDVLESLRANASELAGKEAAVIYVGDLDYKKRYGIEIVQDMVEMTEVTDAAGVKRTVVCTRLPMTYEAKEEMKRGGADLYQRRHTQNDLLRDELLLAYHRGDFPDSVQLVDFYEMFKEEDGTLSDEYNEKSDTYEDLLAIVNDKASAIGKEEARRRAVESKEHPELNDVAIIGSSSGERMAVAGGLKMSRGGLRSKDIYHLVQERVDQLDGMKTVVLQMGGNDIAHYPMNGYDYVLDYTEKTLDLISEIESVEEVLIIATLPFDPRFNSPRVKNGKILREILEKAYGKITDHNGLKVQFVDLYEMFGNEKQQLKKEYRRKGQRDLLHARGAVLQDVIVDIVQSSK